MRPEQSSNPGPGPNVDEGRTRSVGELLQHLGATKPQEVTVVQVGPEAGTSTLEVHPNTEERLNWKPEFVALSRDGRLNCGYPHGSGVARQRWRGVITSVTVSRWARTPRHLRA